MLDGMINVYKEKGYTSHDVVAKLRGILKQKKIGHTGTLDPDAEGVLPVCLGKGTRLCDMLTEQDKTYQAVLRLGITTDTQDMSGNVLRERTVSVTEEAVTRTIQNFIGEYMQIPPMYSALKVNGKKLYELAREGIEVERKARRVQFHEIRILKMDLPTVQLEVTCSKGTYIRTLCHDIGEALGCGGCMESLLRTKVGRFTIESAAKLDQIQECAKEERIRQLLISVEELLREYPRVQCGREWDKLLQNGNPIPVKAAAEKPVQGWVRMYDSQDRFVGIFQIREHTSKYFPVKMFL